MSDKSTDIAPASDRLAKVMARAGLCSRREAEAWITAGRVSVNGKPVRTPAFNVTKDDQIAVDGKPVGPRHATRVWLYHKPAGLMVTERDPEGRPTIYEKLEQHGLPRVLTVGRLDFNTEGLLLLTNDGGLKRVLELPSTGWLRKYRVRAHGKVTQEQLDKLESGITYEGVTYGSITATLEREKGGNVWLEMSLREGKNREIKNVLAALGLQVNRLIRISYGPFQLGDLPIGAVNTVKARVLKEQLGKKLADEAGVDFDAPMPEEKANTAANPRMRVRKKTDAGELDVRRARGKRRLESQEGQDKPRGRSRFAPVHTDRQGRPERPPRPQPEREPPEKRTVHFDDGRPSEEFVPSARKPKRDNEGDDRGSKPFGDKPRGKFGDKPRGKFGDKKPGDKPRGKFGDRKPDDKPRGKFGDKKPGGGFKRDGGPKGKGPRRDGPPRGATGGPRKGPGRPPRKS